MLGEADDFAALHHEFDPIGDRPARIGIDDAKQRRQQMSTRLAKPPAGHSFGGRVHARYTPVRVGGHHCTADRVQRRRKTLFTFAQARFAQLAAPDFFLLLPVGDGQLGRIANTPVALAHDDGAVDIEHDMFRFLGALSAARPYVRR